MIFIKINAFILFYFFIKLKYNMCKNCIEILLPLSNNNDDWEKASEEWDKTGLIEIDQKMNKQCICGQNIKYIYELQNKINKETKKVGSICINTIFTNENLLKFVNYKTCKYCLIDLKREYYDKHKKSNRHIKNLKEYIKKKKYRECKGCFDFCIPINTPTYKKYCMKCYKIQYSKRCADCNKPVKGYNKCYICYKNNANNNC